MSVKIGFAILSHSEPEQLLRLVKTLNAMFNAPPIVCHHDFSQSVLDEALFPKNVRFVHPHLVTQWGNITLPLAALRAFGLLRKYDQPDWFFLLSGSDYPVRPADEILTDLIRADHDVYLDHREILTRTMHTDQTAQYGFDRPDWIPIAYDRYCTCGYWWPRPSKKLLFSGSFPFRRRFVPIHNPRVNRMMRRLQFNRPSRIFAGDFWFHANDKAIGRLLDGSATKRLIRYYRARYIPDESLFHTVLCNHMDLRICKEHKRYEDWKRGGPKWLDVSDVPRIVGSGAYFARKLRDKELLELVEITLLGIGAAKLRAGDFP
jgi:hypothetical protein